MNNSNNDNTGRSMVEMLGVLAIIGVLSAGALKGYSAAMFRHKVNQTIDIFSQALQRFAELEQKDLGENFEVLTAEDMLNYGLISECQKVEKGGEEFCHLPIGDFSIGLTTNGSYAHGEFVMHFTDSKSCVAFLSAGWENAVPVDWWYPAGYISMQGDEIYAPSRGDFSITMSEIGGYCEMCDEEDYGHDCNLWLAVREAW